MFKHARPWLRLIADDPGTPGEGGTRPEETTNEPETPPAPEPSQEEDGGTDFREKYEAQRKINRDLEKKLKGEAGTLTKANEELQSKIDALETAGQEKVTTLSQRVLRAEVRAAAAGKLSDPSDALRFIDLEEFEVSDNGDVDGDALEGAIAKLLEDKPYLAAKGGVNVEFESPGGRREGNPPSQLSQADLKGMTPQEINAAYREGRMKNLIEGK